LISFVDIRKSFGDRTILKGVSFDVPDGEVFFIIGGSGVGKSVLIKHLIGLLTPDSGEIWLDGEEISRLGERAMYPVRMKCAMVFQHATLLDSMNCIDNVALPLRKHRDLDPRDARHAAMSLLERVGMQDYAERFPQDLGDGMKKRVAIARALALEPAYILFDEPTTSLDPVSARRVDRLIRKLSDDLGVTSVVVSHDLTSIFTIADRIAMLYGGHLHLLGPPEAFKSSVDPIVQQFIHGRADGPFE
jgi:phospholipid/cholesterol/gamma-HCH transport system ATP-binding protein